MLGGKTIKCDLSQDRPVNFSEVFSNVKYVKLETSRNHLIGDIKRIRKYGKDFYIQCNNGLFRFSESGTFKAAIGSKGKGTGKFKMMNDFLVDTLKNRVEVLDRREQKILYFTTSGIFLNEWKFGINADTFTKLDDNTYLFYTSNLINIKEGDKSGYQIVAVDRRSGDFISKHLKIDEHKSNFISYIDNTNFVTTGDSLMFTRSASDTVYNITLSQVSPRYIFDFGKNSIPPEFYDRDYKDVSVFDRKFEKTEYAGLFNTFLLENKGLILTTIRKGSFHYLVIYLKHNDSTIVTGLLIDDLYFKGSKENLGWENWPKGNMGNDLFYVLESSRIVNKMDSIRNKMSVDEWNKFSEQNSELIKLTEKMTVADNPIIKIYTLKNI